MPRTLRIARSRLPSWLFARVGASATPRSIPAVATRARRVVRGEPCGYTRSDDIHARTRLLESVRRRPNYHLPQVGATEHAAPDRYTPWLGQGTEVGTVLPDQRDGTAHPSTRCRSVPHAIHRRDPARVVAHWTGLPCERTERARSVSLRQSCSRPVSTALVAGRGWWRPAAPPQTRSGVEVYTRSLDTTAHDRARR